MSQARGLSHPIQGGPIVARSASAGDHGLTPLGGVGSAAKKKKGRIEVKLRAGSILKLPRPVPDDYGGDNGEPCRAESGHPMQRFKITISLREGKKVTYKKWKTIAAAGQGALFTKVPLGRYRIDVENRSKTPCYPDAVAEVALTKQRQKRKIVVVLSTDTLREIAGESQFRVGAYKGSELGDVYFTEFNADVLASYWKSSRQRRVTVPAGASVVAISSDDKEETPPRGIPLAPLEKNVPFETAVNNQVRSSFPLRPQNLLAIRDANGFDRITSPGADPNDSEVYGLLQAKGDMQQISLVRVRADRSELEVVPPKHVAGKTLRYYPYRPALEAIQFTPLVWKSHSGAPPKWDANKTGETLLKAIEGYVADMITLHQREPSKLRQYVTVNEPLLGSISEKRLLGKGKEEKLSDDEQKLLKKPEALVQKLVAKVRKKEKIAKKILSPLLGHNSGSWLKNVHKPYLDYITRSFKTAHLADPQAELILNEHSVEDLRWPKAMAFAVLTKQLKRSMKKGTAAKLSVGFQMHVTPKKKAYPKKDGKIPFIDGLERCVAQYTQGYKMRLFVTELAIRLEGLESYIRTRERTGYQYAIRNFVNHLIKILDPKNENFRPPNHLEIDAARSLQKDANAQGISVAGTVITLDAGKLRLWVNGSDAAGIPSALGTWVSSQRPNSKKEHDLAKELYDALAKIDREIGTQLTNGRTWEDDPAYLKDMAKTFTDSGAEKASKSPNKRRRQQQAFFEVVRACLAANRCDDLAFWGVIDNAPVDDKADVLGHLFEKAPIGAPLKYGSLSGPFRKPCYFGALQGVIEAAVSKGRLPSYAAAQGRTALTRYRPRPLRRPGRRR